MIFRLSSLLLLGLGAGSGGSPRPPAPGEQVLVVTTSGVAAYDEVLDSIEKGTGRPLLYVLDLRQKEAPQILADALRLKSIRVVVTIGAEASDTVLAQPGSVSIIATMIASHLLTRDSPIRGRPVSIIPVHVPLPALLENIKRVFPNKPRLGMIRNPTLPDAGLEMLKGAAEAAGFTPSIAECSGPGALLDTFRSLKDKTDLVLCFPDATLYNSATVKPLVLSSLRYRLPLVGFSESFVRAGAVLAVYPDFRDVGSQAAEMVRKALSSQPISRTESPRRFRVAVNQNITRLLGLDYKALPAMGENFLVIR